MHTQREQPAAGEVTRLLRLWRAGDDRARADLFEVLYPELRAIAVARMRSERPDHTLQPTAVVSEFFLRVARSGGFEWQNRAHFLAVASRAMRRLLIDYARKTKADKAGGGWVRLQFNELRLPLDFQSPDAVEIDELLTRLDHEDARMAQVVELRCFGGLSHVEIGEVLGFDERTIKRDWKTARAWLIAQLRKGKLDDGGAVGTS